jgi:hypothetical protein
MLSSWHAAVVRSIASVVTALCFVVVIHSIGHAGTLELSWSAPTTTVTGMPLTNLAGYRVYYGTASSGCPGPTYVTVPSSTPAPPADQTLTWTLSGLATGTAYYVAVTAVDTLGEESTCVSATTATVARADVSVTPTSTVSFGTVAVGSSADQTFTVQNSGQTAMSGSAAATAPFSVLAGSPYDLAPGASATVRVRFSPTVAASATSNVSFLSPDGSTISRAVSGTGVTATRALATPGADTAPPTVALTAPTSMATVSGSAVILTATASDNVGVVGVQFKVNGLNLGSEVTASPYRVSWYTLSTPNGTHTLTAVARDAAGNRTTSAPVTVTLSNSGSAAVLAPASTAVPAALAYDNSVSSGFQWGVTSVTTPTFVVGTGADRAAMIMVALSANNATDITASLGGVAATLIPGTDSGTTASIRTLIFQVINPPSGLQTARVSWTTPMHADVGVLTVTGANQTTPTSNGQFTASNASPSAATSVTIPSNPGDLTASVALTTNQWISPATNQTFVWGPSSSPAQGDRGTGAGTTTHTWTDLYEGIPHSVSGANFVAARR